MIAGNGGGIERLGQSHCSPSLIVSLTGHDIWTFVLTAVTDNASLNVGNDSDIGPRSTHASRLRYNYRLQE